MDVTISGADYNAKTGTVTFQPGVTTKTLTVGIRTDNSIEEMEQFVIELSTPVNAEIGAAAGTVTIIDRP